MSLPNPGMDAVPFTTLPASFLDDIIENVEALAAGTGLDSSAVTTAKIADGNVTSVKLAEAFLRGRYQSDTSNSAPTGLTLQFGWGYVVGNAGVATEAVTFPTAFSSAPIVLIQTIGARATAAGSPTGPAWFTSRVDNMTSLYSTSTTGFTAAIASASSSSFNYGYAWVAIGTV